jgi:superfamily II DNA or RNA helicase
MRGDPARVLILAHRSELVTQAKAAMLAQGMVVDVEKADEYAHRTPDLLGDTSDVVIASVQTLKGRRLQAWPQDAFGTIVIDEAHHATAEGYRAITDHFACAKVLGVTATPDRTDKTGLGNVFESVAFEMGIREGIDGGWLSPLDVRAISVADLDLSAVTSRTGDLSAKELEQALNLDKVHHEIAAPLAELSGDRSTVVFTAGVDQAQALAIVLAGYVGSEKVGVVHGKQVPDERRAVLDAYSAGTIQYVINCAVLTEGFDAPRTSCIAMARPTKSRSLYTQCVGRGTRLWEEGGKTDCLILDFRGNAGKHTLVHPSAVLAGKTLGEDENKDVDEYTERGMGLEAALAKAEENARKRAEHLEREQRSRWVKAKVAYGASVVDPFGGATPSEDGPRATIAQLDALDHYGIKYGDPSRAEASAMLDAVRARRVAGQCTYKQALVLGRAGLRTDVLFDEARTIMDGLSKNYWRATGEMLQRWGAR